MRELLFLLRGSLYPRQGAEPGSANHHLGEAKELFDKGYREVTLLGQNVNSYTWEEDGKQISFYELLEQVAAVNPLLRVRFATSHPKDISDELLKTIGKHHNICNAIHLPVQSGSNHILKLMNRKYTREWYLDRIAAINKYIPDCAISTDIIAGFCTEKEEDHGIPYPSWRMLAMTMPLCLNTPSAPTPLHKRSWMMM